MKKSSTSTEFNMYDLIFNLSGEVGKLQVKALFNLLPDEWKLKAIQILFGGLDPQVEIEHLMPELPREDEKKGVLHCTGCNLLEDRVDYEYMRKCTRFVASEADVEKFGKSKNFYDVDWSWSRNETHQIPVEYDEKSSSYCTFDEWKNLAFTDEDIARAEASMGM